MDNINTAYNSNLAGILASTEDAIISMALDGTIESWNRGSEMMFGYTSTEMIGKNISIIIPPACINDDKNHHSRISNNKVLDCYETIRIKNNGEQLYVSLIVTHLKDSESNITGFFQVARDITSQKKSEAELIEAYKELAFQSQENGKRAEELLIANKELAFQNAEKEKRANELLIANEKLAFENQEKEKRAEELLIANKDLAYQNQEKATRAAELIIANKELAFQNEEKAKRAAELIVINHELQTAQIQLKEVNTELEAFTYSVSHDLRAPLRAVNSYAQILKEDYEQTIGTDGVQILESICYNSKKMGALIDELLSFSRLGRLDIDPTEIDMNEFVQSILEDFNTTTEHHATIRVGLMPTVKADYTLLRQVLVNLLSNAVKYSAKKEQPEVDIFAELQNGKSVFAIKDNGAGFDMRFADKLFGVFQRLHSEKEFEGNGVGLAIVQRIISKHGGQVWAQGKENEGAIFYFTIN